MRRRILTALAVGAAITIAPLASAQSAAAATAESGITKRECQAAGGTGITPIQDGYTVIRFECKGGSLAGETLTNADLWDLFCPLDHDGRLAYLQGIICVPDGVTG
ncbi:hypothetical protein [Jidongwangia harbinensis]|uniref:hypothetical protein n=1 Tax=Jidongwangia harbinensis TaxID=2878561 RepID=UPI001CDA37DE|nr:hypothetical protein [Jidongwangia harbinensis]MCA2213125.1 hypothetical protein [Jidongwangia harbinensis]